MDWNNRAYGIAPFKEGSHLSGLEFMRKVATGEYPDPPICRQLTFVDAGRCRIRNINLAPSARDYLHAS